MNVKHKQHGILFSGKEQQNYEILRTMDGTEQMKGSDENGQDEQKNTWVMTEEERLGVMRGTQMKRKEKLLKHTT